MKTLQTISAVVVLLTASLTSSHASPNPYLTGKGEEVIDKILGQMTLEEKIKFCQGDIEGKAPPGRGTAALDRLGIQSMIFQGGPIGARMPVPGTVFPCTTAQAATWDTDLLYKIGQVLGLESLSAKTGCLEAPAINIIRDPLNGRNFEYFTEDPYLNGKLAAAFVRGAQDAGIPTTPKHYACNNLETNRTILNEVVSERALREIYLPGYKAAIDAGALGLMTAANKVNGEYCSSNRTLLGYLKKDFGFSGFILTDWNGVQDTVKAANAGTDLSMPGKPDSQFNSAKLLAAVKSGEVSEAEITDKARRLLRAMYFTGLVKGGPPRPAGEPPGPAHFGIAATAAEESMVLLKNNDNVLPINEAAVKKIALLGPSADKVFPGGGSSATLMAYEVTARQGLEKRLSPGKLNYVPLAANDIYEIVDSAFVKSATGDPGFTATYTGKTPNTLQDSSIKTTVPAINFNWEMASPDRSKIDPEKFTCTWTGTLTPPVSGPFTFRITSNGSDKVTVNGKVIIEKKPYFPTREGTIDLEAGKPVDITVGFGKAGAQGTDSRVCFEWVRPDFAARFAAKMAASVEAAKNADAAIVCLGLDHTYDSEGTDRKQLTLPQYQVDFLKAVAKANPHTIAVLYGGSVIDMRSWVNDVPAILLAWYPGIENGNALAKILLGDISPSGKLPITFPEKYEDSPADPSRQKEDKKATVVLNEDIFVGYRWYDAKQIAPAFPFGYGLSYTTFSWKLHDPVPDHFTTGGPALTVAVDITNTGTSTGAEVAQLYVHENACTVPRPPDELKGFHRVELKPGETKTVEFRLDDDSFAFWHPGKAKWTIEPGAFELRIGPSSRDFKATLPLQINTP